VLVSATALALPLLANHVVKRLAPGRRARPRLMDEIWLVGAAMLALLAVQALSTLFRSTTRAMSWARRWKAPCARKLFEHYQSLSFGFHYGQRVGQLMVATLQRPVFRSPNCTTTDRRTWRSRC